MQPRPSHHHSRATILKTQGPAGDVPIIAPGILKGPTLSSSPSQTQSRAALPTQGPIQWPNSSPPGTQQTSHASTHPKACWPRLPLHPDWDCSPRATPLSEAVETVSFIPGPDSTRVPLSAW